MAIVAHTASRSVLPPGLPAFADLVPLSKGVVLGSRVTTFEQYATTWSMLPRILSR